MAAVWLVHFGQAQLMINSGYLDGSLGINFFAEGLSVRNAVSFVKSIKFPDRANFKRLRPFLLDVALDDVRPCPSLGSTENVLKFEGVKKGNFGLARNLFQRLLQNSHNILGPADVSHLRYDYSFLECFRALDGFTVRFEPEVGGSSCIVEHDRVGEVDF